MNGLSAGRHGKKAKVSEKSQFKDDFTWTMDDVPFKCSIVHRPSSIVHVRGAGGSRTLVQTDSRGAFYALSHLLVVGQGPENGTQTSSYPLNLIAPAGKWHNQPEIASAL